MAGGGFTHRRHGLLWLLLALATAGLMVGYMPDSRIQSLLVDQVNSATNFFGPHAVHSGVKFLNDLFSGLVAWANHIRESKPSPHNTRIMGKIFSAGLGGFLWRAVALLYLVCFRLMLAFFWFLPAVAIYLGTIVDGYAMRRLKFATFGYVSPVTFNASSHALVFLAVSPIFYCVLPLPFPPWAPILLILAFAAALRMTIINTVPID